MTGLLVVAAFAVIALAFVCLAAGLQEFIHRRCRTMISIPEAMVLVTGSVGYVAFVAYRLDPGVGVATSFVLYALVVFSAGRLFVHAWRGWWLYKPDIDPWMLSIPLMIGGAYLLIFEGWGDPVAGPAVRFAFFNDLRPGDNWIPREFARAIVGTIPTSSPLVGLDGDGWRFSDRGPLQTGFYLAVAAPISLESEKFYFVVGVFCQVQVMLAVAALHHRQLISIKTTILTLSFMALSGLLFYYSIFVWPKLLAAAFGILAVAGMHRVVRGETRQPLDLVFLALFSVFAMLSHGAAVFTLAAFAVVYMAYARCWRQIRWLSLAIGLAMAFYAPWLAYQKWVDPPGNRLVKMHIAGKHVINESVSALDVIVDAYGALRWEDVFRSKLENLKTIAGDADLDTMQTIVWRGLLIGDCDINRLRTLGERFNNILDPRFIDCSFRDAILLHRVDEREYILRSVFFPVLFGGIGLLLAAVRRQSRVSAPPVDATPSFAGPLVLGQLLTAIIWSGAMFVPGQTYVTHASIAFVVLFLVGAAMVLSRWMVLAFVCLGVMAVNFLVTWVFTLPYWDSVDGGLRDGSDNQALVAFGIALLMVPAVVATRRLRTRPDDAEMSPDPI